MAKKSVPKAKYEVYMAKQKKNKFSSTEDIHNGLNFLNELTADAELEFDFIVNDEMKAIKDLPPDSPEFKKRINIQNFRYFLELSEIYSQEMLAAQRFLQAEAQDQEMLDEYLQQLDGMKDFFIKLGIRGEENKQVLQPVQIERLQRFIMRIEEGIKLINKEINFWEDTRKNLYTEVDSLQQYKQQLHKNAGTILNSYASSVTANDFSRIIIPLSFSPEEQAQFGKQGWRAEVKFDETHFRSIIKELAAQVEQGKIPYLDQADFMQSALRNQLRNEIKYSTNGVLTGEQQQQFIDRNMNTVVIKNAIYTGSQMLNQYLVGQEAKHGQSLRVNAIQLSDVDAKLADRFAKIEKVEKIIHDLYEEKNSLDKINADLLAACQKQMSSMDFSETLRAGQTVLNSLNERQRSLDLARQTFTQQHDETDIVTMRPK